MTAPDDARMVKKVNKSVMFRKVINKRKGLSQEPLNTIEYAMRRIKNYHPAQIH